MLKNVITDFKKHSEVSDDLIRKYEKLLPVELIDLWKEYGFGTFYNGYLKIINPDDYKALLEESYFLGEVSIPIFATAFGDLITWEKNQFVGIVKYRYGDNDVISAGFEYFFDIIEDDECAADFFTIDKYNKAVKKHGNLEYDECFGYVPILALGGKESVNNIKRVKIREHISVICNFTGGV